MRSDSQHGDQGPMLADIKGKLTNWQIAFDEPIEMQERKRSMDAKEENTLVVKIVRMEKAVLSLPIVIIARIEIYHLSRACWDYCIFAGMPYLPPRCMHYF
jgi:hypothetical protein